MSAIYRAGSSRPFSLRASIILLPLVLSLPAWGQRGAAGAAPAARAAAPVDLTGYWVSLITEDWRWRMVTPPKGDYPSIPLNEAGRRLADAWDPAKDEAERAQCKSYGAGNIMRQPGRIHITWEDDNTLRLDADAGTQTRLFHFGDWKSSGGEPTWQGDSTAQWEVAGRGGGQNRSGNLKVVTSRARPGYLQKNGVPYSANAVITEYFNRIDEDNGDSWLIVTTIIEDRQYLTGPFTRSSHFKKLSNANGWDPQPCTAR
jgi:hypothetical protein